MEPLTRRKTKKHFFEEAQGVLDKLDRELSLFRDRTAPSLAPEPPQEALENDTPLGLPTEPVSPLFPEHATQAQARSVERASMAISTCQKCESHSFERGIISPLRERPVPILQCASRGAVVGTLDSEQAIDDPQNRIAGIDAGLMRVVKAIQEQ